MLNEWRGGWRTRRGLVELGRFDSGSLLNAHGTTRSTCFAYLRVVQIALYSSRHCTRMKSLKELSAQGQTELEVSESTRRLATAAK